MKLYIFRAVPLPIIRSLITVHSAKVYVILVCRQLSRRSKAVFKPIWHTPLLSVEWINSWWWTEELPETRRNSCQNKFVKLVYLVGLITKKFFYHARPYERKIPIYILMHTSSLNVMFCANVQYIFLPPTIAPTVVYVFCTRTFCCSVLLSQC